VFGQGMSIAVLEALALQKMLQKHSTLPMHKRTRFFQQKVAKIIAPVWKMVISEDFRYSETTGNKPFGLSIQQKYVRNIFLQSSYNQNVYSRFIKVMNLVAPATILFHPSVMFSIFKQTYFKLK